MSEFLRLPLDEQADILIAMSARMGRPAQILQKDVWACWALGEVFGEPGGIRMAFKGGTSLSKVFNAIHRFSEDIDITLDYRDLCAGMNFDPFACGVSKTGIRRFGETVKKRVLEHVSGRIVPRLASSFSELTKGAGSIEVDESGECVR
ncbi:MAG: nucleotidyl transferase AbiEii/AbiGii toxin family protein, partial [Clostridia bacterium]|nr:nucleotidyl transferase AbiEii/AbiGii toxin family protein [Clostridia bacterium]